MKKEIDIEQTAKVIFFNPEMEAEILETVNQHIFVDKKIEDRISEIEIEMLSENKSDDVIRYYQETLDYLQNFLNALKKSHL